jgi:hypothetical protein
MIVQRMFNHNQESAMKTNSVVFDYLIDLIRLIAGSVSKDLLIENLLKPRPILVPRYLRNSKFPGLP